jgi:UDP-glucose 4-epimerase
VSVDAIVEAGHEVVVLDDLTTGHRAVVPPEATLVEGTYADEGTVRSVLAEHPIDSILPCAARALPRPRIRARTVPA